MNRLVPCRFIVQVSLLELDEDDGEPVNEHPLRGVVLYGVQAMRDYLDTLPKSFESESFMPMNGQDPFS